MRRLLGILFALACLAPGAARATPTWWLGGGGGGSGDVGGLTDTGNLCAANQVVTRAGDDLSFTCSAAGAGDILTVGDCANGNCFVTGGAGTTLSSDTNFVINLDANTGGSNTFSILESNALIGDTTLFTVAEGGGVGIGSAVGGAAGANLAIVGNAPYISFTELDGTNDTADDGRVRLGAGDKICWETGVTDDCLFSDGSGQTQFQITSLDVTGTVTAYGGIRSYGATPYAGFAESDFDVGSDVCRLRVNSPADENGAWGMFCESGTNQDFEAMISENTVAGATTLYLGGASNENTYTSANAITVDETADMKSIGTGSINGTSWDGTYLFIDGDNDNVYDAGEKLLNINAAVNTAGDETVNGGLTVVGSTTLAGPPVVAGDTVASGELLIGTGAGTAAYSGYVASAVWNAGGFSTDGTDCATPIEVSIASGPKFYTVACPMGTSETDGYIYGNTVLVDSIDIAADATFEVTARVVTDNAGATAHGYIEIQCVSADATASSTWSSGANLDVTQAAGDVVNDILQDTSASVDLAQGANPDCAGGDTLFWRYTVCDTDASPSTGCTSSAGAENDHDYLSFKMEYTKTASD